MPINSTHPIYDSMIAKWQRCRDAYDGDDAIKAGGETYLPKMSAKQPADEYRAYLMRASFYEAPGRTVDGFVGAISRKAHTFVLPPRLEPLQANITGDGVGINEFVRALSMENILQGRAGVLVDLDGTGTPFLTIYRAEQITNWAEDGSEVVVFETAYQRDPADPLKTVATPQYRQFHLVDGAYAVTTWRKRKVGGSSRVEWFPVERVTPTKSALLMGTVPWVWCSMLGVTDRVTKPPLLGLVNVAISHFRSSADLEHGRHFAGRPTLYVTGANPETQIRVGGASAIVLENPQAKVGYAEFTGQGLQSLETALASKEKQIAAMGAAAFAKGEARSEPVVTAQVRAAAETSVLAAAVVGVEEALTAALRIAADWISAPGELKVGLNRDFVNQDLDPQTFAGLVAGLQTGQITTETFVWNLDQAGMMPPNVSLDEEAAAIRAAMDKIAAQGARMKQTGGAPA